MKTIAQIINPVIKENIGDLYKFPNTFDSTSYILQKYLVNFIRLFFIAGSVIMLFMLIWGGIEYITAGGEKEKVSNSTKRITNALIGIFILLSTYAFSKLINLVF